MTKAADIINLFEQGIAPAKLAEKWDPVGLQIGNPDRQTTSVLLCLDVVPSVVSRAVSDKIDLIISHHPLIFSPLKNICPTQPEQKMIYDLIKADIPVFSAHTNLDAAVGGVADSLALILDLPTAGWRTAFPSTTDPDGSAGHGRFASLAAPADLFWLRKQVIDRLGSEGCRINTDSNAVVSTIGVFPGSFSEEWIDELSLLGIDTVITGEAKHHVGLMLAARGINLLAAGHDVTERVVLFPLAAKLSEIFTEIRFAVDDGLDYNKVAF